MLNMMNTQIIGGIVFALVSILTIRSRKHGSTKENKILLHAQFAGLGWDGWCFNRGIADAQKNDMEAGKPVKCAPRS